VIVLCNYIRIYNLNINYCFFAQFIQSMNKQETALSDVLRDLSVNMSTFTLF